MLFSEAWKADESFTSCMDLNPSAGLWRYLSEPGLTGALDHESANHVVRYQRLNHITSHHLHLQATSETDLLRKRCTGFVI